MTMSVLRRVVSCACLAGAVALSSTTAWAQDAASARPTVCNIKVVSDKVPDVSSLEAWKKSFIDDKMTNQEKAMAIWKSVVMFQYQDGPPAEYLHHEDLVYDAIKMFNVYGYAMCSPHTAHMSSLARYIGFEARGWAVNHHSVGEFFYDNSWHHFDSSLISYFIKDDGTIASLAEVTKSVVDWFDANPEFKDLKTQDKMLREFQKQDNRQGWKKGPKLIASAPMYDHRGWWPAGTHGWYATMSSFDGSAGKGQKQYVYEYSASAGYQLNIQLRPGEKLIRNWGHTGQHINQDVNKGEPDALNDKQKFMTNVQNFMNKTEPKYPALAVGRIGNGTHEYNIPLASGAFKSGALTVENLVSKSEDTTGPGVHVKDGSKPGVLVIRMPSSYVYLGGSLTANAVVGDGGGIDVELSDNHGLDWKPVAKISSSGEQKIDLGKLIRRRYDYRLRFTMKGKGTGLETALVSQDIQHSQRPLPALDKGDNKIAFSAGPQESTITIEANNKADHGGKQVTYKDFHPVLDGISDGLKVTAPKGTMTVPVTVPGDMTRLRLSASYRTWDEKSKWDFEVSFDGGKTFKKVGEGKPQKGGRNAYVVVNEVPAGTKEAQVRYIGHGAGTNVLGSFRIDADYKTATMGFSPIKVTYSWEENGQEKKNEFIAKEERQSYTINCAEKPKMKSIVLEVAE
jgi:hypothetical protein